MSCCSFCQIINHYHCPTEVVHILRCIHMHVDAICMHFLKIVRVYLKIQTVGLYFQPDIMRPVTVDLPRSPPAAALLCPTLIAGLAGADFLSVPSGFFASDFLSSGCLSSPFLSSGFFSSGFLSSAFLSSDLLSSDFLSSGFLSSGFLSSDFLSSGFLSSGFLSSGFFSSGFLASDGFCSDFLSSVFLSPPSLVFVTSAEVAFAASAAPFGAASGFPPLGAAGAAPLVAVPFDLGSGLPASVFFSSVFLTAASGLVAASGLATSGLAAAFVGGTGAVGLLSAALGSDVFGGTGGAFELSRFNVAVKLSLGFSSSVLTLGSIVELISLLFYCTEYSARNSDSIACKRFNSQDNSNAVNTGSRELNDIKELADKARYALIRDCE
uniref:Uncharacterized protein n=1 Tax=Glossina brevipalpis TaxID=37001 RepID=A0A1A9WYZ8_9MUSC